MKFTRLHIFSDAIDTIDLVHSDAGIIYDAPDTTLGSTCWLIREEK